MVARFVLKLSCFVPLLLLVAGVNYRVDPANLFHEATRERQAAGWLAQGHNVEGLADYDERKFQLYWLQALSQPREMAVLGSSRAMTLSGPDLLNHFVSGATVADLLALSQLYADRGWTPRKLIVVADPWLFNRQHRETRWKSLAEAHSRALASLGLRSGPSWLGALEHRLGVAGELLSPSYFQASLERAWSRGGPPPLAVTALLQGERAIKRSDGSLAYPLATERLTPEQVREAAIRLVERPPVYGLERYEELDPELQRQFEAWLRSWQGRGTQVSILLAPYHPEAWRRLAASPRFRMVGAAEAYLRSLGYPVYGSYRPLDCSPADFYDGQHPKPACMRRLLERVRARERAEAGGGPGARSGSAPAPA